MIERAIAAALAGLLFTSPAPAQPVGPAPVDPLTVTIDDRDARRFRALWQKTGGNPTIEQLQADYISGGGRGLEIFTPQRIVDAANLHKRINANRGWYEQAVGKCLDWIPQSQGDLRSIYLGLRGLLPEMPLPQIYIVVGGGNSGGTAGPGAQVLGLEVLCRDAPTPERFRALLRNFFAHETAHTFQGQPGPEGVQEEPLLRALLAEGGADYIAWLVTGATPDPERDAVGSAREAELWAQFVKDRPIANRGYSGGQNFTKEGQAAFSRWFYSNMGLPSGWEPDMGYWLGMQIARAFVDRSPDPRAAIRELLALENPAEILEKSGYARKFPSVRKARSP